MKKTTRPVETIREIIIHCSASPNGKDFKAKDIDQWHKARGFIRDKALSKNNGLGSIGYHFVIGIDGTVEAGRTLQEIGAHCIGRNQYSIGVCLVGTDKFTHQQWDALNKKIISLKKEFPNAKILGHRDTSPDKNGNGKIEPNEFIKICPGFSVKEWLDIGLSPLKNHLI